MRQFGLWVGIMVWAVSGWAVELQPDVFVSYEKPGAVAIVTDKSECSVNIFEYQGHWEKKRSFLCTIGKVAGDKFYEGDLRTPVGIYWLVDAWTGDELRRMHGPAAEIYGSGAFELNYPNYVDRVFHRKNGSGIWLHGTDKGQPVATRGCISTSNADFMEIAKYINLHETPFIVEDQITYTPKATLKKTRQELLEFIEQWRQAWESSSTDDYLSFYSKSFKTDRFNYKQWRRYKQIVNEQNQERSVKIDAPVILQAKGIFNVRFTQNYKSSQTKDVGYKELYIVQEGDQYWIVGEAWEPLPQNTNLSPLRYAYKQSEESSL